MRVHGDWVTFYLPLLPFCSKICVEYSEIKWIFPHASVLKIERVASHHSIKLISTNNRFTNDHFIGDSGRYIPLLRLPNHQSLVKSTTYYPFFLLSVNVYKSSPDTPDLATKFVTILESHNDFPCFGFDSP